MNDYVTLHVNTYNRLYDKAKAYDKMMEISTPEDDYPEWDVEMIAIDSNIPYGAKGKFIQYLGDDKNIMYVNWKNNHTCTYPTSIAGIDYENACMVNKFDVRFLNEREEN